MPFRLAGQELGKALAFGAGNQARLKEQAAPGFGYLAGAPQVDAANGMEQVGSAGEFASLRSQDSSIARSMEEKAKQAAVFYSQFPGAGGGGSVA